MTVQPRGGLDQIVTTLCGSSANGTSLTLAVEAGRRKLTNHLCCAFLRLSLENAFKVSGQIR
jgi:hypothetical protein